MYDVIIIGKGPAGISASLYTARANLKTLIIGGTSWLSKTYNIDNYYGIVENITGEEILKRGELQAKKLGVEIVDGQVTNIQSVNNSFVVSADRDFESKAVLIATGQNRKKINIEGVDEFEGKGIHYCTVCDGFFYRNKKLAVMGNGDFAISEAVELLNFTDNVVILTNGNELKLSDKYKVMADDFAINKKKIAKFEGEDCLQSVYFEDDSFVQLDGVFIANDIADANDFARKLGIIIRNNGIVVNEKQETNLNGIFAAGDCTGGFKQVAVAVGQGAIAGKSIIDFVK